MLAVSITNLAISNARNMKKDTTEQSREREDIREGLLKANMKLDQVCATTNETRADIKSLNNGMGALDKRVSIIERDVKTAFVRIDELRERQEKTED
jgi:septal ring factor EnvC (AmiA/AmiB activator)